MYVDLTLILKFYAFLDLSQFKCEERRESLCLYVIFITSMLYSQLNHGYNIKFSSDFAGQLVSANQIYGHAENIKDTWKYY